MQKEIKIKDKFGKGYEIIEQNGIIRVNRYTLEGRETRLYVSWEEMLSSLPVNWLFGPNGIFHFLDEEDKKFIIKNHKERRILDAQEFAKTYNKYAERKREGEASFAIYDDGENWYVAQVRYQIWFDEYKEVYYFYVLDS